MQLEASQASIRALKASDHDQRTLLEKLFAYELEPPQPPTPPPKPKQRLEKDEARARKQARAAKYVGPRIPGRSTRHTVAMGIDALVEEPPATIDEPEDGARRKSRRQANAGDEAANAQVARVRRSHTSDIPVEENRNATRSRRVKADPKLNGVTDSLSGDLTSASSGEVVPLERAERGVVGKETYSPLGPKERRERDRKMAMELVVEDLDSRADFKRFNVGWVLPEGTKRGGRRERLPDPVVPKKRKCKRCGPLHEQLLTLLFSFRSEQSDRHVSIISGGCRVHCRTRLANVGGRQRTRLAARHAETQQPKGNTGQPDTARTGFARPFR